jgi:hypothetical protein
MQPEKTLEPQETVRDENTNIMSYESVLPEDFDGTFRFSNPSEEDFVGKWGGKEYRFPAGKTVQMVMPEYSPLEIQHIRKKFAKNLAEREFYKTQKYGTMAGQEGTTGNRVFNSIHQAATYTIDDLTPYIQSCLKPLEDGQLTAKPVESVKIEDKLSRNDEGELNTEAISGKTSLREKALKS